jgi:hypothetical protein
MMIILRGFSILCFFFQGGHSLFFFIVAYNFACMGKAMFFTAFGLESLDATVQHHLASYFWGLLYRMIVV